MKRRFIRGVFYCLELKDGHKYGIRINEFSMVDGKELQIKDINEVIDYCEFVKLTPIKKLA